MQQGTDPNGSPIKMAIDKCKDFRDARHLQILETLLKDRESKIDPVIPCLSDVQELCTVIKEDLNSWKGPWTTWHPLLMNIIHAHQTCK
jgi:hypothetical protein